VLLDMVGDADLTIRKEPIAFADARFVVDDVWERRLGSVFANLTIAWRRGSRRPCSAQRNRLDSTADLIDFDYPHWHTEADLPDKCPQRRWKRWGSVYEWLRNGRESLTNLKPKSASDEFLGFDFAPAATLVLLGALFAWVRAANRRRASYCRIRCASLQGTVRDGVCGSRRC